MSGWTEATVREELPPPPAPFPTNPTPGAHSSKPMGFHQMGGSGMGDTQDEQANNDPQILAPGVSTGAAEASAPASSAGPAAASGGKGSGGGSGKKHSIRVNDGVEMPSTSELEEIQLANLLTDPATKLKTNQGCVNTGEDIEQLLDSNYALLSLLTRLRYRRPPGKPTLVERKVCKMLEENLGILIASQTPSAMVTPRAAQATRAIMRHARGSELGQQPHPK